jgi:lipopolysaccharide export system protein LptC
MTVEANVVPGVRRYRVRSAEERMRAFRSARRHSKLVTILRRSLPVFAVLVLASYFISSQLAMSINVGDVSASIDGIEVNNGNLRMLHPKLDGIDKKNGKYLVTADYADQDIKNPNLITLHTINADLAAADGGWSRMAAPRGLFDNKTGRLVLQDKIGVSTSSGVTGQLTYASLDTKNQVLRSHRPVSFVLPNGTVRANTLTYYAAQHTLTFRGKVAVHIDKSDTQANPAPKPQAPAGQKVPAMPKAEAAGESTATPMLQAGAGEQAIPPLPGKTGALPDNSGAEPVSVP